MTFQPTEVSERGKVEQLQQGVHAQLVLFTENVSHLRADTKEVALSGNMAYRLVKVEKLADYWLVAHMVGYGAEAVILRNTCHVVLAVVLPQGLGVPCDAPFATELRHRSVDCNTSHDGDNSSLLPFA